MPSRAPEPSAPYYLAQAVIVQEKGLEAAAASIEELEQRLRRAEAGAAAPQQDEGGGFLSSIFGSPEAPRQPQAPRPHHPAMASAPPQSQAMAVHGAALRIPATADRKAAMAAVAMAALRPAACSEADAAAAAS